MLVWSRLLALLVRVLVATLVVVPRIRAHVWSKWATEMSRRKCDRDRKDKRRRVPMLFVVGAREWNGWPSVLLTRVTMQSCTRKARCMCKDFARNLILQNMKIRPHIYDAAPCNWLFVTKRFANVMADGTSKVPVDDCRKQKGVSMCAFVCVSFVRYGLEKNISGQQL